MRNLPKVTQEVGGKLQPGSTLTGADSNHKWRHGVYWPTLVFIPAPSSIQCLSIS